MNIGLNLNITSIITILLNIITILLNFVSKLKTSKLSSSIIKLSKNFTLVLFNNDIALEYYYRIRIFREDHFKIF